MKNKESGSRAHFPIRDSVDVRITISKAMKLPALAVATEIERSVISTIISELGTNIVKYADYGHLYVTITEDGEGVLVEISAQDDGPGMADVDMALQDHYTTGNTLGLGLPAVKRMADDFRISSAPGCGTTVVAMMRLGPRRSKHKIAAKQPGSDRVPFRTQKRSVTWDLGSYTLPMPSKVRGGDFAITLAAANGPVLVMLDVTGHGERAYAIGCGIASLLPTVVDLPTGQIMQLVHDKLVGTVGAALGILAIDADSGRFSYVGVGNTGIARVTGERWRGISRDGLVGSRLPRLLEQTGSLVPGDAVLMWTDGISEIQGPRYLAKNSNQPAQVIARDLVNTLGKPHDDAGCIVLRWHP